MIRESRQETFTAGKMLLGLNEIKKNEFQTREVWCWPSEPQNFSVFNLLVRLYFQGECNWNWFISRSAFLSFITVGLLVLFTLDIDLPFPFFWCKNFELLRSA